MVKTCPFAVNRDCDENCPLYINPSELNELVSARLCSIGVLDRQQGECSLKMLALSQGRMIFENTKTRGG